MNEVEAVRTPEQRTQLEAQLRDAGQIYYDAVSYTHLTLPTNREV